MCVGERLLKERVSRVCICIISAPVPLTLSLISCDLSPLLLTPLLHIVLLFTLHCAPLPHLFILFTYSQGHIESPALCAVRDTALRAIPQVIKGPLFDAAVRAVSQPHSVRP